MISKGRDDSDSKEVDGKEIKRTQTRAEGPEGEELEH